MGKIKNFFTDDGNLKAITFGLMAGTSLMALISIAALIELEWSGTRAIAEFFGLENIKQNVAVDLALAFMSAVSYWAECHRVEHKCIMRLIELLDEEIDRYSQSIDGLAELVLAPSKSNKKERAENGCEDEK